MEGLPDATDLDGCGHGGRAYGFASRNAFAAARTSGRRMLARSASTLVGQLAGVAEVRLLVPDGRLVDASRPREASVSPIEAERLHRQLGVLGDDVPVRRVLPAAVLQLVAPP